ncbi:hypothetical protein BS333_01185 [Vibrio azureus]|uniref:O-antigen ligase-related domain-containing protein n=1 Tax=Vibrio azureus NBRC 104587 TaxID=1219077 RepID=U3C134_9VIBR|nr:O-antigen ligase family protein [Vibrio azureus]AUI85106.1 hypothetical protein BS333_01185 [Vibrio azureus]GAD75219.1 hypothetical protein VAZ01S_022_00120 [Vibrio azureus NBRC 104587]
MNTKKLPLKEKIGYLISLPPFLWIFSGQLTTNHAYKALVGLISISLVISCCYYGPKAILSNLTSNRWLQILALMLLSAILFQEYNNGSSTGMLRAYACMLVLFISIPTFESRRIFSKLHWYLLLSSIVLLTSSFLHAHIWHTPRALWPINAITFTTISAVVAACSLIYALLSSSKRVRSVGLLSFTLSLNSILIGQTRGVILALVVAAAIIIILTYRKKQLLVNRLAIVGVLSIFSIILNSSSIIGRINSTKNEITHLKQAQYTTSIGIRLQLWSSSIYPITDNPLLGIGDQHQEYRQKLFEQKLLKKEFIAWDHYHNQYVDKLVRNGLIGLMLFLLLVTYPLTQLQRLDFLPRLIVIGTISVCATAALTDVPLTHVQPFIIFVSLISLCLAQGTNTGRPCESSS